MKLQIPDPFLDVIVHEELPLPGFVTMCAGFESGEWRGEQLASHLMEWLPEFCLTSEELDGLHGGNAVQLIRRAAKSVYQTKKFENRGEFGELLLHAALRQVKKTLPAISKIFYKDAVNNTVKGFDAVHVVPTDVGLELWLGEVKFYKSVSAAIRDVLEELKNHLKNDYLRSEFALISNKIDETWMHSDKLKKLLHENTSLDAVFDCVCIPVLITYNSDTAKKHKKSTREYRAEIEQEVRTHYKSFQSKLPAGLPSVKIHLFLIPLDTKEVLIEKLDSKLRNWQAL